eukprot:TRINITY_DN4825_c0_g1_i2.p1 TRINITY_DN4825_c0_g1~~TRINITY_DN4825_c0_g1_i2.p1  ORF type:complete len:122 (+),score=16.20 TRINITY_DN4825_c0_g1_i2:69-434(+)
MTRGVSHRRVDSFNEFETASENNNWLRSRFFIPFYILLILGLRYVVTIFSIFLPTITIEIGWTVTNVLHNVVSFFLLHWMQGTPFEVAQGRYYDKTVWEQLDNGAAFTKPKRIMTAIPVFL